MSRLMSVSLTKEAVRERRKTVTRRLAWGGLSVGTRLTLCEKVQGRRKGDPLVRLAEVEVIDVSRQQIQVQNTPNEAEREGFPDWSWTEFVAFFCAHMKCDPTTPITRIEWRYLDAAESDSTPANSVLSGSSQGGTDGS